MEVDLRQKTQIDPTEITKPMRERYSLPLKMLTAGYRG
jgi:hypothetical protein